VSFEISNFEISDLNLKSQIPDFKSEIPISAGKDARAPLSLELNTVIRKQSVLSATVIGNSVARRQRAFPGRHKR
jgi:hypothetical protein